MTDDITLRPGTVDGTVYTSEQVFEAELERIFRRTWVYVGHESEVPEQGDYCLKDVAGTSLIMVRSNDDVRVFVNRCRHRGNALCQFPRGRANIFRCPYHGWTYRNSGELVGVPYPSRDEQLDPADFGLAEPAAVDSYQGLVFVRLLGDGPDLIEHLGEARPFIDDFVKASPTGRIAVRAGCHKGKFRGNWKFVGMDGYHANFTHKTVRDLQRKNKPESNPSSRNTDRSTNRSWDLGNGHSRLDFSNTREPENILGVGLSDDPVEADYRDQMVATYGEAAEEVMERGQDPHVHIWPNLQLIGVHIRVVRPVSARLTEVDAYPTALEGASDDLNARRLRSHEWFFGPAGFGQPDDYEIFERNEVGLQTVEPWILLSRGLGLEEPGERGMTWGNITDEIPQRAQLKAWQAAMGEAPTQAAATGEGEDSA